MKPPLPPAVVFAQYLARVKKKSKPSTPKKPPKPGQPTLTLIQGGKK